MSHYVSLKRWYLIGLWFQIHISGISICIRTTIVAATFICLLMFLWKILNTLFWGICNIHSNIVMTKESNRDYGVKYKANASVTFTLNRRIFEQVIRYIYVQNFIRVTKQPGNPGNSCKVAANPLLMLNPSSKNLISEGKDVTEKQMP